MFTVEASEVLDAGPSPPLPSATPATLTLTVTFCAPETPWVGRLKLELVAPAAGWPLTNHWY